MPIVLAWIMSISIRRPADCSVVLSKLLAERPVGCSGDRTELQLLLLFSRVHLTSSSCRGLARKDVASQFGIRSIISN
jgi:hypothetical protein